MRSARIGLLIAASAMVSCTPFSGSTEATDGGGGDAGDASNGGGDAAGSSDGGTTYRLVFLSNATLTPGGEFAATAAHICTSEGQKKKASSSFVPWVSISGDAASSLSGTRGWALSDGTPVFSDASAVTKSALLHVIDSGAEGGSRTAAVKAWTGTRGDGLQKTTDASKSCQGFGSGNGALVGTFGLPAGFTDARWTDQGEAACDTAAALVCFEL